MPGVLRGRDGGKSLGGSPEKEGAPVDRDVCPQSRESREDSVRNRPRTPAVGSREAESSMSRLGLRSPVPESVRT